MSYTINTTSGNVLVTLLDGTIDSSTGLTLIGRNYPSYGLLQNDNFVRLLENFSDSIPPTQHSALNPLTGMLWYDSGNATIKSYDSINWNPVSGRLASGVDPKTLGNITIHTGDQWWDITNQQLNSWNGTSWQLIGPAYTASQGKTGSLVELVTATNSNVYTVVNTYTNGNLVSVTSANSFTPTGTLYSGIATIRPGVNLPSTNQFSGNATNSFALGGVAAANYARTDIASAFAQSVSVGGTLTLTNGIISYSAGTLTLQNTNLNGNIAVVTNTGTNTNVLNVNGSTGLVTVAGDPTNNLGVATKQYVDNSTSNINSAVAAQISTINGNVGQLRADYFANIASVQSAINSNVNTLQSQTIANTNMLIAELASNVTTFSANIASLNANLGTVIYTDLPLLAPLASPSFTGTPTAPTPAGGDNSGNIATTAFAANIYTTLYNGYLGAVSQEVTNRNSAIATAVTGLAPNASPHLTGTPTAPTPTTGDSSTSIATTAFVATAITNATVTFPHITYGTTPPQNGQGNNGDYYFQYV